MTFCDILCLFAFNAGTQLRPSHVAGGTMILQTHVAQTLPDNGKFILCARGNRGNGQIQLRKLGKQQLIQDVQWIEDQAGIKRSTVKSLVPLKQHSCERSRITSCCRHEILLEESTSIIRICLLDLEVYRFIGL